MPEIIWGKNIDKVGRGVSVGVNVAVGTDTKVEILAITGMVVFVAVGDGVNVGNHPIFLAAVSRTHPVTAKPQHRRRIAVDT